MTWMTHWSIRYFSTNVIQKLTYKPNKPLPLIENNRQNDHKCNILCTFVLVTFFISQIYALEPLVAFIYYFVSCSCVFTFSLFCTFLYLFISLYCILFVIVVRSSWVFRKVSINKMVYYYLIFLVIPSKVTFLFSYFVLSPLLCASLCLRPKCQAIHKSTYSLWSVIMACFHCLFHILKHTYNHLCLKPKLFLRTPAWSTSQSRIIIITHFNLAINFHTHSSHSKSV